MKMLPVIKLVIIFWNIILIEFKSLKLEEINTLKYKITVLLETCEIQFNDFSKKK